MVVAILRDAREKQCITEPKGSRSYMEVLRRDDRFLMILNDSELDWQSKEHMVIYREAILDGIEAPILNLEPYKQSLKCPSLAGCIQLASEWLARCEKSHAECNNEDKSDFEYPLRLIDIADESQRLIIVNSSRSRSVRYMALSHCCVGIF
ncbi:hypothetical protein INS49_010521 [Diaporthe citri]|uniref:uncharacterized protein n=1 Tax=Diaporthe citri TaxID=83186 RepID=UPI001C80AD78|nr:uncharacterized protein INS49_010521 [Diaporthe citri]KAG6362291.1 hypothetical protein INS49_010521 [Diaporthe citri]